MSSVWLTSALSVPSDGQIDGRLRPRLSSSGQVIRVRSIWKVEKSSLGTALFHCPTSDTETLNNVKLYFYQRIRTGSYFWPRTSVYLC